MGSVSKSKMGRRHIFSVFVVFCQHIDAARSLNIDCNLQCSLHLQPVCGTNDVTYPNICKLEEAACVFELVGRDPPELKHKGKCAAPQIEPVIAEDYEYEEDCPGNCITEDYSPVCGSDGITYSNPCTLSMASCSSVDEGGVRVTLALEGPCRLVDV